MPDPKVFHLFPGALGDLTGGLPTAPPGSEPVERLYLSLSNFQSLRSSSRSVRADDLYLSKVQESGFGNSGLGATLQEDGASKRLVPLSGRGFGDLGWDFWGRAPVVVAPILKEGYQVFGVYDENIGSLPVLFETMFRVG